MITLLSHNLGAGFAARPRPQAIVGRLLFAATILALQFVLNSCASEGGSSSRELGSGTVQWFSYDASRRGAYILPASDGPANGYPPPEGSVYRARVVVEPAPDVAMASVTSLLAKANFGELDVDVRADLSRQVVELGKRATVVSFLRESLFRLSEMASNGTLSIEQADRMFHRVMEASTTIGMAEVQSAQAARVTALRDLVNNMDAEHQLSPEQITAIIGTDGEVAEVANTSQFAAITTAIAGLEARLTAQTGAQTRVAALELEQKRLETELAAARLLRSDLDSALTQLKNINATLQDLQPKPAAATPPGK